MDQFNKKELATLKYIWKIHARPNQVWPIGNWLVWLLMAGRGFGKTKTGAETIRECVEEKGYKRIGFIAGTAADVRDVMIEGESGILACSPPWFYPEYEPSKRKITWPNGAIASLYSAEEPDRLRGPQHDLLWADEPATWKRAEETWDMAMFGLRIGNDPRAIGTTTPRPIPLIKRLVKDETTVISTGSSYDNVDNLAPQFFHQIISKYEGTRLGRQEIYAELLTDTPGALWKMSDIDRNRVTEEEVPDLESVCVAVDPAATSTETSSKTGIIVKGRGGPPKGRENGHPNHYYTLADGTLHGSPQQWATAAIRLYYKYEANCIVVEVNHGGDMIKHTLSTVDPNVKVVEVRASRGKYTRAEPIAALAEQGRDHHVGTFAALEDQQTTWLPGDESPDEMDADVWGTTHLMSIRSIDYWIPEG